MNLTRNKKVCQHSVRQGAPKPSQSSQSQVLLQTVSRIDFELAKLYALSKTFCVCTDNLTKIVTTDENTIAKFGQETR